MTLAVEGVPMLSVDTSSKKKANVSTNKCLIAA